MLRRGNKPVGRTARILYALSLGLILAFILFAVVAMRQQQAFPSRGAASLPGQAAGGGADPGGKPAGE